MPNKAREDGKNKRNNPAAFIAEGTYRSYLYKVLGEKMQGVAMSNDAKLGLVLGVAIVLMIALVFFRNDMLNTKMPAAQTRPTALQKDFSPKSVPHAHIAPPMP